MAFSAVPVGAELVLMRSFFAWCPTPETVQILVFVDPEGVFGIFPKLLASFFQKFSFVIYIWLFLSFCIFWCVRCAVVCVCVCVERGVVVHSMWVSCSDCSKEWSRVTSVSCRAW